MCSFGISRSLHLYRGLMYAPSERRVQASYTFLLRITCKKGGGGEGVQKACKNAYIINGRPHNRITALHCEVASSDGRMFSVTKMVSIHFHEAI